MGNRECSVIGFALLAMLAACATDPPPSRPEVLTDGMPSAELALERSLARIDRAMTELGGLPVPPSAATHQIAPAELQRPVSFAWSGPLDEGARALADRVGYQFVVYAPKNPKPVLVSVTLSNVPILDVFRELGTQAGADATLAVDWDHHQVEVDHHD
jgi:defect in organelle trafficking protein DotD